MTSGRIGALVVIAVGMCDVALARENVGTPPVEKIAATKPWGGKLPTWQDHIRKGFDGGKWNAKCAAGRARARNNPHGATIRPPACIRT